MIMVLSHLWLIIRAGVASLLLSTLLLAQNPYGGRIIGRVTDSSGALVPNAVVECVNLGTNVVSSANTTSNGNFELPNLIPGQYLGTCKIPDPEPLVGGVGTKQNREEMYSAGRRGNRIFVMSKTPIGLAAHHA
jgi:hypothetical protein